MGGNCGDTQPAANNLISYEKENFGLQLSPRMPSLFSTLPRRDGARRNKQNNDFPVFLTAGLAHLFFVSGPEGGEGLPAFAGPGNPSALRTGFFPFFSAAIAAQERFRMKGGGKMAGEGGRAAGD